MRKTVLIVGANGRFGRAMACAFHQKGWTLKLFARAKPTHSLFPYDFIQGDALKRQSLVDAAKDCAIIVNALSPPYSQWSTIVPQFTKNIIAAAKTSGATILIPGNIYNFGEKMPEHLTENTPQTSTGKLGKIREEMEEDYAQAIDHGVQTIILRAGDFIEQKITGNWFDSQVISKISKGRITYPGPMNCKHSWAYLPDMARAFVEVAEQKDKLNNFETIGFPGYSLTGAELTSSLEKVVKQRLKVSGVPWPVVKILSVFKPDVRGVVEMSYLWRQPHRIDGKKLSDILPSFIETPILSALRDSVSGRIDVAAIEPNKP